MPGFGPISRVNLIRALKSAGWDGPFSGGNHQYMLLGTLKLFIPNPHGSEISRPLLNRLLQQAGISRDEWEKM